MSYILYMSFPFWFHVCKYVRSGYGNNCMYPKVLSLYETVISIYLYPKVSSLYETVTYAMCYPYPKVLSLCFQGHLIQTGSMSSTQTGPRYLSMYMLQQLYLPYRHAYLSLYQVPSRQSVLLHFLYISHKHE